MKKFTRIWIYTLAIMGVFFILSSSCSKKDDNNNPNPTPFSVTDIDGNIYHTVTIGTQVWMVENLKTTKYRNGDNIPNITNDTVWFNLTFGAYCNYYNDPSIANIYGRLYNWYAVNDSRKIAPTGWHVPTDAEWTTLTTYLGGESVAGGKLKEASALHWNNPNTGATNESGFTALPGGHRYCLYLTGLFYNFGIWGTWWSSTEDNSHNTEAMNRYIYNNDICVVKGSYTKNIGNSIRCIMD